MRSITSFLCILSLLITALTSNASFSCIGEKGEPVDWWVITKLPLLNNSNSSFIREGTGYLYYDTKGSNLNYTDKSINDPASAPGRTLSQIYNSPNGSVGYAMYNDESPDKKKYNLAHSKGVVGYDYKSGFWLIHSVPAFPPYYASRSYSYPDSGKVYGQSMLCISLTLHGINTAGRQFRTNGPNFYDYFMPPDLIASNKLTELYRATYMNNTITNPPENTVRFESTGGTHFLSIAKSKELGKDLYSMLVAPTLQKSLLVETWIRGDKVCTCASCVTEKCNYQVDNVYSVDFGGDLHYKYTFDHSKWAVTKDKLIMCIGDINRMTSQFVRGGGTVCFLEPTLADIYASAAQPDTCEDCQSYTDVSIELDVLGIDVDIEMHH